MFHKPLSATLCPLQNSIAGGLPISRNNSVAVNTNPDGGEPDNDAADGGGSGGGGPRRTPSAGSSRGASAVAAAIAIR